MRRTITVWTVSMLAVLAAAVPAAGQWVELEKLTASDAAMMDGFGYSVGVSGDTVLVGSVYDDDLYEDSGSVYLFDAISGNQRGDKLTASDADEADAFGFALAISGNIAIVGAPDHHHVPGVRGGSAYLFDVTTGQALFELLASDREDLDHFGTSVAISGNTAIVGAYGDDDGGDVSGAAYLFDVTTGLQIGPKLVAPDAAADDEFGYAVGISGNTAIVGAHGDDDGGNASGSAYLFDVTTGQPIGPKLTAPDPAADDQFGYAVAISGNTAIVAARGDDGMAGAAYLFDATTGLQIGSKLTAPGAPPNGAFGQSVAVDGDTAIVGAYGEDGFSGAAYLFDLATGGTPQRITPSDPSSMKYFGHSVAVSGGTAVVGAIGDGQAGYYAGAAYLNVLGTDSGFRLNGVPIPQFQLPSLATPALEAGDVLSGQGTRDGVFVGQAGSAIVVDEGDMTLGEPDSFAGFTTEGTIDVGSNTLALHAAGFAGLGVQTTIDGGKLEAAGGVALGVGDNLVGQGTVDAKIAAALGSTISATGDLALGNADSTAGFASDGELHVGPHTVTIRDSNQALLGSLTTLGKPAVFDGDGTLIEDAVRGTLQSDGGLVVEFGKNVTGYGKIDTPNHVSTPLLNNGFIGGNSADEPITLNGYVKGVGSFTDVVINGTLSPGLSPAEVTAGRLALGDAATLVMEIGGRSAGSEYDVLRIADGLALGGTLRVELIGGFRPQQGDAFDLFHFDAASGQFAAVDLPELSADLAWDSSALYQMGRLVVVPEPSTVMLLGAAVPLLLMLPRRTTKRRPHVQRSF